MSHMHIPDGVLPLWLILLGWLLTVALLALVSRRLGRGDSSRQLPLLGVMSAVMLVGMSVEIAPIAYHTNLSVLAGIVLGPALGVLAAFIVNLMLALFGHGGITVVGLNTLVIAAEVVLGHYLFRGLWWLLKRRQQSPTLAAGLATALALVASTLLMIAIVGVSQAGPTAQSHALPEGLSFQNPFEHGLINLELPGGDPGHGAVAGPAVGSFDLLTFAKLVAAFGVLGWLLESVLTGAIVGFVYRVRPDLVGGRRPVPPTGGRTASPARGAEGHTGGSATGEQRPSPERVG